MSASWEVWARDLKGLTPSEMLVVGRIAALCDARGVAIVKVDALVNDTGRARRTVLLALSKLESRGLLTRTVRRSPNGTKCASRMQLLRGATRTLVTEDPSPVRLPAAVSSPGSGSALVVATTNDELRRVLHEIRDKGWQCDAVNVLAATLVQVAPAKFGNIYKRRVRFASLEECKRDTLTLAWESIAANLDRLVTADTPWAMLTTIVSRQAAQIDEDVLDADALPVDPHEVPEYGARPGEGDTNDAIVGVDDFGGSLSRIVDALVDNGMDETLAYAGTVRVAEIAVYDKTRRHTVAARDYKMEALGVSSEAARTWMTMLAGSRTGRSVGIVEAGDEALRTHARSLIDQL